MTKILLYLFLLILPATAAAQIINIPDINFRNALLAADETTYQYAKDIDGNFMTVDANNDNYIQQSEANLVYELYLSGLDINVLTGIQSFTNLHYLDCSANNLTSLIISALVNLESLYCGNNSLTALDISGVLALEQLFCQDNQLAALDFSGLENLNRVDCSGNQLTELDFSDNPLDQVNFVNNSITYINLKNGAPHSGTFELVNEWSTNPLEFICADESETETIYQLLGDNGFADVHVTNYCSFTPGGDYNTITGTLALDSDINGCDAGDLLPQFMKVTITDGAGTGAAFTDSDGNYAFYTQAGEFTVAPAFENDYFTVAEPSTDVDFPVVDNSVTLADFCLTPNGVHNDVEVVMVPVVPAQPGLDAVYKIVYRNKGNQPASGSVTCNWDFLYFEFVDVVPNADIIAPNTYTWNYTNLLPFENREIFITLNVNSPTDTPAVNEGDILPFTAFAAITGTDETPVDNTFQFNQKAVGAADPNNIICIQGDTAPADMIGEYLHYVVNFENTGTAPATSVVVRHELNPAQFDISTLQVLNSSHDVTVTIAGNIIEFIFQNISLNAADHGNILFKAKSKSSLHAGQHVAHSAEIYFDYDFPVETNEAITTFEVLGIKDFTADNSVKIYPNPVKDIISIEAGSTIQSVSLYDLQGRLLQTAVVNDATAKFDISSRAAGIYLLKVTTAKGVMAQKIIKE